ncbi:MAG TPA: DUF5615 family PIN-like protein [Pseudonocardia sp.]
MKFLVDAQLPLRLARALAAAGHDAIHTSDLPHGNRSTDTDIARRADVENRVVVTKDRDFRDGHLLAGSPRRLLVVATGNSQDGAALGIRRHSRSSTLVRDDALDDNHDYREVSECWGTPTTPRP